MSLLGLAVALMLIFEGLMPLVAPKAWRQMFSRLSELSDGQIRFFGLIAIAVGALLFWLQS
ncbi:MAG: DUF2065 domain-containing protein [Burkholderiaceae bacterium]|nr:DUF2065 domain-containing protein [Burkholderiaceae bacterium]